MVNISNIKRYTEEASIVGVQYFSSGYNWLHKLFWIILVITCSAYSIIMCIYQWNSWLENPEATSFTKIPISEIPFPAVTICPEGSTPMLAYRNIINQIPVTSVINTSLLTTFRNFRKKTEWFTLSDPQFELEMEKLWPRFLNNEFKKLWWFESIWEEWFYKVDTFYIDSCASNGSYCRFHNSVVNFLIDMQTDERYKMWMYRQNMNVTWTWDEDLLSFERAKPPKMIDFFVNVTELFLYTRDFRRRTVQDNFDDYLSFLNKKDFSARSMIEWGKDKDPTDNVIYDNADNLFFISDCLLIDEKTRANASVGEEKLSYVRFGNEVDFIPVCKNVTMHGVCRLLGHDFQHYLDEELEITLAFCPEDVIGMENCTFINRSSDEYSIGVICDDLGRTRIDSRCGPNFPIGIDNISAECDSEGLSCCSTDGYCGTTDNHCYCDGCFRNIENRTDPSCGEVVGYKSQSSHYVDFLTNAMYQIKRSRMVFNNINLFCFDFHNTYVDLQDFEVQMFDNYMENIPFFSIIHMRKFVMENQKFLDLMKTVPLKENMAADSECSYISETRAKNSIAYLTDLIDLWEPHIIEDGIITAQKNCFSNFDDVCTSPDNYDGQCACNCEKMLKLEILKVYIILSKECLVTDEMEYLGALLASIRKEDSPTWNKTRDAMISEKEVLDLEVEVLRNITGIQSKISLFDYLYAMSLHPVDVKKGLPMNFSSINNESGSDIQKYFLRYKTNILGIDGKAFPNVCNDYLNYCNLSIETETDLENIFLMMDYATHPNSRTVSQNIFPLHNHTYSKSHNNVIPLCMFGPDAVRYASTPDIRYEDIMSNITVKTFLQEHKLEEAYAYRFPKCQLFEKAPSDMQLCHTFNANPLSDRLNPSSWLSKFQKIVPQNNVFDQKYFYDKGSNYGMHLILDLLTDEMFGNDPSARKGFWIKLHHPNEIPNLSTIDKKTMLYFNNSQDMINNVHLMITADPTEVTERFGSIPFEKRRCRLPTEQNKNALLTEYTESNCIIECRWSRAYEVCGCKPWYIPSYDHEKTCFFLGNVCFNNIMKELSLNYDFNSCDCPWDCDSSEYTMEYLGSDFLSVKSFCDENSEKENIAACKSNSSLNYNATVILVNQTVKTELTARFYNLGQYILDREGFLNPQDTILDQFTSIEIGSEKMKQRQSNFFIISLFLDPTTRTAVEKKKKDISMSLEDKISWIGGTIGGFNGFCLLSGVEIIYWILLVIFGSKPKIEPMKEANRFSECEKSCKHCDDISMMRQEFFELKEKISGVKVVDKGNYFDVLFDNGEFVKLESGEP